MERILEAKVIGLGGVSFVRGLEWRRSLGFLIDLSVRTAFLRVAATAGTSAHIIFGGNGSQIERANYLTLFGMESCKKPLARASRFGP